MTHAMSNWAALSSELWAKIFNYMQPVLHCQYIELSRDDVLQLRRLSAVCTSFRTTLVQHPHLESAMLLPEVFQDDILPVMVQYIKQRHACLQTVVSDCNPYVECALVALLSAHCSIKEVLLAAYQSEPWPRTRVHLLARFRSLTTCMLNLNAGQSNHNNGLHITSLFPFYHLPHLSLLEVYGGIVHDLDAARHLISLTLTSCEAVCSEDCLCTSSLVQLRLSDCLVANFHTQGVPACQIRPSDL